MSKNLLPRNSQWVLNRSGMNILGVCHQVPFQWLKPCGNENLGSVLLLWWVRSSVSYQLLKSPHWATQSFRWMKGTTQVVSEYVYYRELNYFGKKQRKIKKWSGTRCTGCLAWCAYTFCCLTKGFPPVYSTCSLLLILVHTFTDKNWELKNCFPYKTWAFI
jgi:hypothetical protein